MDPKTLEEIKNFADFGLSVQEIHDIYFPKIPLREIATSLELPAEEIERIVKSGKAQPEKPKVRISSPRSKLSQGVEDPLARYISIEKPEKPLLLSQKKIDLVECPMISRQQILDKLVQVKANVNLPRPREEEFGPTRSFTLGSLTTKKVENISLGPNSQKIAESLQKALTTDSPEQKRVFLTFGKYSDLGDFVPGISRDEADRVRKYLDAAKYQWSNTAVTEIAASETPGLTKVSSLGKPKVYRIVNSVSNSPEYDYQIVSVSETLEEPDGFLVSKNIPKTQLESDVWFNANANIKIKLSSVTFGKVKGHELELEVLPKKDLPALKQVSSFEEVQALALTLLSQVKDAPVLARTLPSSSKLVETIFQGLLTKPSPSTSIEVEASLGKFFGASFVPGVTYDGFVLIGKFLAKEGYSVETKDEYSKVEIDGFVRGITVGDLETVYQRKDRTRTYDSPSYGYRISSSTETTIPKPESFDPKLVRNRKRSTFWNPQGNAKVELTEVTETDVTKERSNKKFEVEIELLPQANLRKKSAKVMTLDELYAVCMQLILVSEGASNQSQLMTRKEYADVVAFHNNVLKVSGAREGQMTRNYLSKPVNLKLADLLDRVHNTAITNKLDGERAVVLITTLGVYSYVRDTLSKIGVVDHARTSSKEIKNNIFILDCEVTERSEGVSDGRGRTFWPFDVLAAGKDTFAADVRNRKLPERDTLRQSVSEIQGAMTLWSGASIDLSKTYYYPGDDETGFYENIVKARNWESAREDLNFDGFIFQPVGAYFNEPKKWKPAGKMTIDFLLRSTGTTSGKYEYLVKNKSNFERPDYGNVAPLITLPRDFSPEYDGDRTLDLDGIVAECKFDVNQKRFSVYRLRPDRPYPNDITVAQSVFDDILRPLSLDTMLGQDLTVMRYAHNRTKEFLLENFRGKKIIVDVGSGQGGDLRKWSALGLEKVFALEPSEEMRTEFKKRFDSLPDRQKVGITLKSFGVQDTEKVLAAVGDAAQGVAAFFSLTFLGGSKSDVLALTQTVSGLLRKEGERFVGIVMDGKEVHSLLDRSGGVYTASTIIDGKEKVLYTITDTGEESAITSGFTSRKIVVDIPGSNVRNVEEWTFPFGYFTRLMKEQSFRIVPSGGSGYLSPSSKSEIAALLGDSGSGGSEGPTQAQVNKTYSRLPFASKVFSSLQKFFIFERGRNVSEVVESVSLPSRGRDVEFHRELQGVDFTEERLQLKYVLQNNSAIFASFLEVYDPSFYNPTESEKRQARVKVLTKKLALLNKKKSDEELIRKTQVELDQIKASGRKDGEETSQVNAFRKTLQSFIEGMDEDSFPTEENSEVRIFEKYGGQAEMAEDFGDPKEEIPLKDAVDILSIYCSEDRNELVTIVVLGSKGVIHVTDCYGADSVILIYQTFSEVAVGKGAAIPADVRSTQHLYFPIVPGNSDTRLLSGHENPGKALLRKVCPE